MTDLLSELTEIPFEVFLDKWQELNPGIYNRDRAERIWFYMKEESRIEAFKSLSSHNPLIQICREPWHFLNHFDV